jgi:hypothetical protein
MNRIVSIIASVYVLAFITPPLENGGDYSTTAYFIHKYINFKLDKEHQLSAIIAQISKQFT